MGSLSVDYRYGTGHLPANLRYLFKDPGCREIDLRPVHEGAREEFGREG